MVDGVQRHAPGSLLTQWFARAGVDVESGKLLLEIIGRHILGLKLSKL